MRLPVLQRNMEVCIINAENKVEQRTVGLMINVLGDMQEELSINKISFLHKISDVHLKRAEDALLEPDADGPPTKLLRVSVKHRSLFSSYKILQAINAVQVDSDQAVFSTSMAMCLHIDESTDVSNTKLLMVYVTIVGGEPDPKINGEKFGAVLEMDENCDASSIADKVHEWLKSYGIPPKKVMMFTSDGAAVMLGRHNGVAQRLRRDYGYAHLLDYHCICHRENLAMKDAYQDCAEFVALERILKDVISYLTTTKNLCGLKTVAKVMGTPLYAPHRIYEIRWLSRYHVLSNFVNSMETILTFLEQRTNVDGDYQALPLHKRLADAKSLALLYHLHDVLAPVDKLMVQLQKSDLHPFRAMEHVQVAIAQLQDKYINKDPETPIAGRRFKALLELVESGNIRPIGKIDDALRKLCEKILIDLATKIVSSMEDRLWNNHDIIENMKIFWGQGIGKMTGAQFSTYGEEDLEALMKHYKNVLNLDEEKTHTEWDTYKYTYLKAIGPGKKELGWREALRQCIDDYAAYPNLGRLAAVLMCFNAQNATVERGFSTVNRLRTKIRNRMLPRTLDMVMRIRVSTAPYDEYDYDDALRIYKGMNTYGFGIHRKRAVAASGDEVQIVTNDRDDTNDDEYTNSRQDPMYLDFEENALTEAI